MLRYVAGGSELLLLLIKAITSQAESSRDTELENRRVDRPRYFSASRCDVKLFKSTCIGRM